MAVMVAFFAHLEWGGKILPSFWKNLAVILVKICRHFDENMPTI